MHTSYRAQPCFRYSLVLLAFLAISANARHGALPYSLSKADQLKFDAPTVTVAGIDAVKRRMDEDTKKRTAIGSHSKELRVADGREVSIKPEKDGQWETLVDGSSLWRVKISAPGATDLRMGFLRYALPVNASLHVIGFDQYFEGPYTAKDATDQQLWIPAVPGDKATIELHLPAHTAWPNDALELTYVGVGFRDRFNQQKSGVGDSGACNINVACSLGDDYPDEIRAVADFEFVSGGDVYLCSGTLLADVPQDRRNYFLTAAHCISTNSQAASMVLYWNYQATQCSGTSGYTLSDNQSGASLRATRADADFTLVELSQTPDEDYHVYYAGWDATGTTPAGSIGIHHPAGDVKKITENLTTLDTIDNCIGTGGSSSNTHWLTGPYSQGTTEGGSSGSALFVPSGDSSGHDNRVIGTLSGGDAACSVTNATRPNSGIDCYGKLAWAWNGSSASSRLRDWLDPENTGTKLIQGIDSQDETPTPTPTVADDVLPAWAAEQAAARFHRN